MKNIYKTLSLLIIFSISQNLKAQDIKITWGKNIKMGDEYMAKIIKQNKSSFYTLGLKRQMNMANHSQDASLNEYSKSNLSLISSKKLVLPKAETAERGTNFILAGVFCLKGKMIALTPEVNLLEKKDVALVQYVNDDGTINPDIKEADEISPFDQEEGDAEFLDISTDQTGFFNFISSADSSLFMVCHNEVYKQHPSLTISCKVFDLNLNQVWSKNIELPYKNKQISLSDYTLDNNGDIYMLAKIVGEKEKNQTGSPNYKYEILYYNHSSDVLKEYKLESGKKYITCALCKLNTTGDLVSVGFYSDKNSYSAIGSFYLKIDAKTKVATTPVFNPFNNETLESFLTKKQIKNGKGINDLSAEKIFFHDDGSAYLIAEQYWDGSPRSTIGVLPSATFYEKDFQWGGGSSDDGDNINSYGATTASNIMVINFAPDASTVWAKHIFENQREFFISHSVQEIGKKLYFIYNDNVDNLTIKDPTDYKAVYNSKMCATILVTMDADGEQQRTLLFKAKETDGATFIPSLVLNFNTSEDIFCADKTNGYMFGKFKLK